MWLSSVHLSSTAAVFQMKLLSTSMLCFPLLFCQNLAAHTVNFFSALFLIHFRWKHRMKKNPWKTNYIGTVFHELKCLTLLPKTDLNRILTDYHFPKIYNFVIVAREVTFRQILNVGRNCWSKQFSCRSSQFHSLLHYHKNIFDSFQSRLIWRKKIYLYM